MKKKINRKKKMKKKNEKKNSKKKNEKKKSKKKIRKKKFEKKKIRVPRELRTPKKNGVIQIKNRFYLFFIYLFGLFFCYLAEWWLFK